LTRIGIQALRVPVLFDVMWNPLALAQEHRGMAAE
jgi:hypothetical protein